MDYFTIFTLNVWGLPFVSKDRRARIEAIAQVLAKGQYDVVCLQEVWLDDDFNLIKNKVSEVLPYSHYFYSGVTGSGVCVLSRYPIEEAFFHQWPINGYIHKIHHGDWFGGKGVGLCRIKVNKLHINVYSSHLHAEYDRDCDEYQAHRVLQAFDTAQFILLTSGNADLVVLAGDLNTEPGDLAYKIMLTVPGLKDAFYEADEILQQKNIATIEAPTNSYTPAQLIKKNSIGKRIDYIMYHPGERVKVSLKNYELPLSNKVPNENFSYSDHEAVVATLILNKPNDECPLGDLNEKKSVLMESICVCDEALKSINNHKIQYLLFSMGFFILLVILLSINLSFGWPIIYHIFEVFIGICMVFTILMATLWNNIERHAVISGKLSMELSLKQLDNPKDS